MSYTTMSIHLVLFVCQVLAIICLERQIRALNRMRKDLVIANVSEWNALSRAISATYPRYTEAWLLVTMAPYMFVSQFGPLYDVTCQLMTLIYLSWLARSMVRRRRVYEQWSHNNRSS